MNQSPTKHHPIDHNAIVFIIIKSFLLQGTKINKNQQK